jgi:CRP/FNR family transcriptional regulator, cyclic AMP receptor protein
MRPHPHFLWLDLFRRKQDGKVNVAQSLRSNILFKNLTERELRYMSNLVYERVYQPDEPIFRESDRGIGMYLIVAGRVSIRTNSPQGEVMVTSLEEGSFFGELALVDPENIRSASAVATERTVVIGFFKPDLMELLERKPDLGVKILFQLSIVLGRRLLETTEKITLLTRARNLSEVYSDAV